MLTSRASEVVRIWHPSVSTHGLEEKRATEATERRTGRRVEVGLAAELGQADPLRRRVARRGHASRASYGAPDWQVDAWVSTYTAMAAREVTDDIASLTGDPATSLAELVRRGGTAY